MMDQRQGDPRIYIVTLLFLSCIISGGVLLGLYLILSDPNPLFLQAGMVFAGLPWLFWFVAYLYSCILKPCTLSVTNSVNNSFSHFDPEKGEKSIEKRVIEKSVSNNKMPVSKIPENMSSTTDLSAREGEKHVQFGNVVVLGDAEEEEDRRKMMKEHMRVLELDDEDDGENGGSNSSSDHDEDCDRTPLRLSVGNK